MVEIEKLSKENLDLKGRLAQIQSVHVSVLTALNKRSTIENRSISSGQRDTRVANNIAQKYQKRTKNLHFIIFYEAYKVRNFKTPKTGEFRAD